MRAKKESWITDVRECACKIWHHRRRRVSEACKNVDDYVVQKNWAAEVYQTAERNIRRRSEISDGGAAAEISVKSCLAALARAFMAC